MKLNSLRCLLLVDAMILFFLGGVLIVAPMKVEEAFHFHDLPPAVTYLIGLWGCVFATMAIGYAVAAIDPLRHLVWVQVGIARGILECIFGIVSLVRGVVTLEQAGFGIVIAALVTVAYLGLYPRAGDQATAPATSPVP